MARGRPRKSEAEKLRPVTTNLTESDYVRLCQVAEARGESVAEVVRRLALGGIKKLLNSDDGEHAVI